MDKLTSFFTELMRRYLPDPFVFAIGMTLLTVLLAMGVEGQSPIDVIRAWGSGFWSLLAFTTQMAVILAAGYVLATAPLTDRLLNRIVGRVHEPRHAIIVATLVGGLGSYLNWGFGLVIGGVIARKLALKVKGVHYPLIIAAAYSGFTMYGLGLSASIPVLVATPGHPLEAQMGTIPLSQTIFSLPMLLVALAIIVTLPLLNAWLQPRDRSRIVEVDASTDRRAEPEAGAGDLLEADTIATRLNNSRILSLLVGLMGIGYVIIHFAGGGSLDLNLINFIILFLGIILLGTPAAYVTQLNEGIRTIGGIILQYPFYAGIMAIMAASGLVGTISRLFVDVATPASLPFWGLVSSYFINFFAPSAGGHWVIQGPFMIDAAHQLGSAMNQNVMSVMLGNAWNDLVQPFWILPALALSRLKLRDVMSYTVIMMLWVGAIHITAMLLWGYLTH
ncbi:short-chain fatty acid transporter [Belnapia rosea]|uniref:short-chain fatty acid transporter n=1 Tax=Belnapia rosea TaxID=938405 RepID=UPI00087E18B9|nr:TIGR00366 family protein [Belnapia rosea]SDB74808.1 short-chain fatty acids transporter [Belnapia rosea]